MPDGSRADVADAVLAGAVWVIDTASNTVVATIPVGVGSSGVAITPDGTRAYVTNQISNTVSVIDTTTNTVVVTVPVGSRSFGGSRYACATSSDHYKGLPAWWVSEVRSACRTFQESRAVRQLCRASLA